MTKSRGMSIGFWILVTFAVATKVLVFLLEPETDPAAMWGYML